MINLVTIIQFFTNLAANQDPIVKIGLIAILIIYLFFALILTRQIFYFNNIIDLVTFSPIFKIFSLLHLLLTIILLIGIVLFV